VTLLKLPKPPVGAVPKIYHPLYEGIVGAFLFNEGGGDIIQDYSPYRMRGVVKNNWPWVNGGMQGDGSEISEHYATVSNASTSGGSKHDWKFSTGVGGTDYPFSVAMGINIKDATDMDCMVALCDNTTNPIWMAYIWDGRISLRLFSSMNMTLRGNSDDAFVTSGYHNVLITYDGSKSIPGIKLYLDGVSVTVNDASVGSYTGMATYASHGTINSQYPENEAVDMYGDATYHYAYVYEKELTNRDAVALCQDPYCMFEKDFSRETLSVLSRESLPYTKHIPVIYSKPPLGSRINTSTKLGQRLVASFLANERGGKKLYDSVSSKSIDLVGTVPIVPEGRSFDGSGDYLAYNEIAKRISGRTGCMFLIWRSENNTKASQYIASIVGSGGYRYFLINDEGKFCYRWGAEGLNTTEYVFDSEFHSVAMTWRWNDYQIYFDGIPIASGSGNNTVPVNFSIAAYSSTPASSTLHAAGTLATYHLFDSHLLENDIAQLHADPYCMFEKNFSEETLSFLSRESIPNSTYRKRHYTKKSLMG